MKEAVEGGILGVLVLRWGLEMIRSRNGNSSRSILRELLTEEKKQTGCLQDMGRDLAIHRALMEQKK